MTQFERLTKSPETLGAFLKGLPILEGPWDTEFQKRVCARCAAEECDSCPHAQIRNNPGWWLKLEAERDANWVCPGGCMMNLENQAEHCAGCGWNTKT